MLISSLLAALAALNAAGIATPMPVECTSIDNVGNPPMAYCETPWGIHYDEPGIDDGVVLTGNIIICPEGWTLSFDEVPGDPGRYWSACM